MTDQATRLRGGRERSALRNLLIAATAAAGRDAHSSDLHSLVNAAPIHQLPEAAALHRVSGSVLQGLETIDGVPQSLIATLSAHRWESLAHHLVVTRALQDIGAAWDHESIRWLVMKGPAVAVLLHSSPGNRTYGDLDLLIERHDLARATEILEELGYRHAIKDWALAERMLAGEFSMSTPTVQVDVHWHVMYSHQDRRPFDIEPRDMLERSRRVTLSQVVAPTFDEVDTLMMLAFHAARSGGHRLIWLKDIERSVAVESIDFDELVRRTRRFACAPPVGLMLLRTRRLLDAEIPDDVLVALTGPTCAAAERMASATKNPIQFHERDTSTRLFTRSVKSSLGTTAAEVPRRAGLAVGRRLLPSPVNETANRDEKDSYMRAVRTTEPT